MPETNPFANFPASNEAATTQVESLPARRIARDLFWSGWTIASIAKHIGEKRSTVETWKQRGEWDKASALDKLDCALEQRLIVLIAKDSKDGRDFKEIDLLGRQIERVHQVRGKRRSDANASAQDDDATPNAASARSKRRSRRNAMDDEQIRRLCNGLREILIGHQHAWFESRNMRMRNILKSRQIGATFYFALEALIDALETGRNQVFLSASRAQAHVFRQYIAKYAWEVAQIELTGDPIILPNGAYLIFLGTSSRTAQSYNGNLYFDEYFWVGKFETLNNVASGIATHKHLRMTYFSTPSTTNHEAYPFWTGADFNRDRRDADKVEIDVSHTSLARGLACADGQWRQIVTAEDAVAQGFDKLDLDDLRSRSSEQNFANKYLCQFIDDTASVFKFADLQKCMVDAWEEWADVEPLAERPFGFRPVWIGYDPALTSDAAGCIVIAPPNKPSGVFRVLERFRWNGMDFEAQADAIRELTRRYNVQYISLDATGIGAGVHQLVCQFFPRVTALQYSPEIKNRLVLKGMSVVGKHRLQFDASMTDLAQSFMAIRRAMTASGARMTFVAARNSEIGHADLAWACLHALDNEPLEGGGARRTTVEFF